MNDDTVDVSRRAFLRTAAGTTAAAGATGAAAAQTEDGGTGTATPTETVSATESGDGTATPGTESGNGTATPGTESGDGGDGGSSGEAPPPDYGNWFSDVENYDGTTVDARGQDEVTVDVGVPGNSGTNAFGPPAVHVSPGTTVKWEWTGDGTHNVVSQGEGPLDSGTATADASTTYEYTFEDDGMYKYICVPHQGLGMKGAVVVGTDYPAKETSGGDGNVDQVTDPAKAIAVSTTFVMAATLGLAYVFLKYGGQREDGSE